MIGAPNPLQAAAGWKLNLAPAPPLGAAAGGLAAAAKGAGAALASATPLGALFADDSLMLTHSQFRADISVSKGLGLDGGRLRMSVANMPFALIQKVLGIYEKALEKTTPSGAAGALLGTLKLFWRVALPYPGLDAVADLAGAALGTGDEEADLAAVFVVTSLSTESSGVGYQLRIEGVDQAWHTLNTERVPTTLEIAGAKDIAALCAAVGIRTGNSSGPLKAVASALGLGGGSSAAGGAEGGGQASITAGERLIDRLNELGQSIAMAENTGDLGAYLIDNGTLLIGDELNGAFDAPMVDLRDGLDVISVEAIRRDIGDSSGEKRGFSLRIRGNAAVKAGCVLKFNYVKPELTSASTGLGYADAAIGAVGAVGETLGFGQGEPVCLYIRAVRHLLSASSGFVTEIDGIQCGGAKPVKPEKPELGASAAPAASKGTDAAAGAIKASLRNQGRTFDIAEIRAFRARTAASAPGQTEDAFVGLGTGQGQMQRYRTVDIHRVKPQRVQNMPYVTPFAWGSYGLVLPRYPGTRVAVIRPEGSTDQAVDIGALWWSGESNNANAGPPDAQPGDYWLILPVDPQPAQIVPEDTQPLPSKAASASNDLIDSAGRRTVEVREFTLRVGDWALKGPGERPPASAAAKGLRIEGKDGETLIEIDADGNLTLKSAKSIRIEAGETIALKASGVEVNIGNGKMDVS